ncbi:MAG: MltA domain-containing protein [Syntrophobacterales bacterium]|nr:MAG: MltA domain-containing protein [Syntrophobacterales bacterium]
MRKALVYFLVPLILIGCVRFTKEVKVPERPLILLQGKDIPSFEDDLDRESLRAAISRSMEFFRRLPEDRLFEYGGDHYSTGHLINSMKTFLYLLDEAEDMEELTDMIREQFNVYQSVGLDGRGTVLYTGYYEPILEGSITPNEKYRWPLYKRPDDLMEIDLELFSRKFEGEKIVARYDGSRVVPYFSREEIDSHGVLFGRELELAWLKDPIDVFFLHIQGSGQVLLEDGTHLRVNYSACNGRPYRSIGSLLIDRGIISKEEMNISRLREYLRDNPSQREEILNYNESYVFFRVVEQGPLGNIEVPLTPGRSVATDSRMFPKGALVYVCGEKPIADDSGTIIAWIPFSRFVLNQDTGGAIKGPGRVDLFWGKGESAGIPAGYMKNEGRLYFLVEK